MLAATAAFATVTLGATAVALRTRPRPRRRCNSGGRIVRGRAVMLRLHWPPSASSNQGTTTQPGSPPPPRRVPTSSRSTRPGTPGPPPRVTRGCTPAPTSPRPYIQDAAAAAYVQAILDQWHDIAYVPINWYYPAAARNPALMDIIPAPQAGNRLTIRQYKSRWLNLYQDKLAAGDPERRPPRVVRPRRHRHRRRLRPRARQALPVRHRRTRHVRLLRAHPRRLRHHRHPASPTTPPTKPASASTSPSTPTTSNPAISSSLRRRPRHDLGHVAIAISPAEEIQAPAAADIVKITPIPYARVQAVRRLIDATSTDTTLPEKS